jgi:hypothetical protein
MACHTVLCVYLFWKFNGVIKSLTEGCEILKSLPKRTEHLELYGVAWIKNTGKVGRNKLQSRMICQIHSIMFYISLPSKLAHAEMISLWRCPVLLTAGKRTILIAFVALLSPSRELTEYYLGTGHGNFLLHSFQLFSLILTLNSMWSEVLGASLNKPFI